MQIDALNPLTHRILGAAIEVHKTLGPGLLESIYLQCLERELTAKNLPFIAQQRLPVVYKGNELPDAYRVDLIIESLVVVEVKAVTDLLSVHNAQVLTYMKLTSCPAGLLINFSVARLMDGVRRFVLPGYRTSGLVPPAT